MLHKKSINFEYLLGKKQTLAEIVGIFALQDNYEAMAVNFEIESEILY